MTKALLIAIALMAPMRSLETRDGPVPGNWTVSGRDAHEWSATLVFTRAEGPHLEGFFLWRGLDIDASGFEPFIGTYDSKSRWISLTGRGIYDPRGPIATARYTARLSSDLTHLVEGRWYGPEVEVGTWTAVVGQH